MTKFVVANWKMNMDLEQIAQWISEFSKISASMDLSNVEIVVAPSYIYLEQTKKLLADSGLNNIKLAAQGVSEFENGAHTSQVSAKQLSKYCDYAIVGHSETGTSNESKMKMAALCSENNIKPIVCYTNLQDIPAELENYSYVAWEDPTNISKNGIYNPKNPQEIISALSQHKNTIIYGGSVNENNIKDLATMAKISGYLIGNASLKPETFCAIIEHC